MIVKKINEGMKERRVLYTMKSASNGIFGVVELILLLATRVWAIDGDAVLELQNTSGSTMFSTWKKMNR